MTNPILQPSLSAGELAPNMYGRVDLDKYHSGCALSRNFFVDYRGGIINRAGTKYVLRCLPSTFNPRLIPFTFSTIQTYILVFGNLTMRVIMDGGEVLEPAKTITNINQANPGTVTSASHGFSNGDWVYITGVIGMTQINGKDYIVANKTANNFQLTDLNGNSISTLSYAAYTSGGTVARIFTLTTPYLASDLPLLKFVQSADTMTLTHPSYAPRNLTRTQHYVWTLTTITFGPKTNAPTGASAASSDTGSTQYKYVVTAIGANGLTESRPSNVASTTGHRMSDFSNLTYNTVSWTTVAGATQYNIYRTLEIPSTGPASGAIFGFIGAADETATSYRDSNFLPDMSVTPPSGNNPFLTDWPACATYYQQRLCFAGTPLGPNTITLSKSADFYNMDYSMPTKDDDSIVATLASQQVNAIKHLVPITTLIALTSGGAWKIDGGTQSDALTPTHIVALPQVYTGCSDVPPLLITYNILYVQSMGNIVRDLHYNFYTNVYTGDDVSMLANHLFDNHSIIEWTYAEQPHKIVWAVREDGIAISLTYLSEQQIYGWARHDTDGIFQSTASVSEGEEDAVYFIIQRVINGTIVRYVERMASRVLPSDVPRGLAADLTDAWFVDAGLAYPRSTPAATLTPASISGDPQIWSISVIDGGSGYTAPAVEIVDSMGTGATAIAVMSGGVITGITVVTKGTGYLNPTVRVLDQTGISAVLSPYVKRPVVMTASASVFTSGNVGDVVRINYGLGSVIAYNSGFSITVDVTQNLFNANPALAGAWSITTPVSSISGLDHLEGKTVSILADGSEQTQKVVTNGAITLENSATAIVVGLPIQGQFKTLYLSAEDGKDQGKRKKVSAVTFRVKDTRGLKVGPDFTHLTPIKERSTQPLGYPVLPITGDERIIIQPTWNKGGQIVAQQDSPLPAQILAVMPEVTIGDT